MRDVFAQAFRELKADRFRTRLSLLGVAVGIFSIVAALTLVDTLQGIIRDGFSAYGGDILFVDREPLEPDLTEDGVFRWWEYAARPAVSWQEYRYLKEKGEGDAFRETAFVGHSASRVGVAGQWRLLTAQPLSAGRGFTERELLDGLPVAIVGADVKKADGGKLRCGEALWIDNIRYEVIGVFQKAGMNTVSTVDVDHVKLVPWKTLHGEAIRTSILLSGADLQKVRSLMRECRRLTPLQDDNFALNRLSFILEEMNEIFSMVAKVGWIVGVFALLVGGFGIANMLYVSVEERKPQIGICRAIGAKRSVIVKQFLGEAAILSLLGGAVGILSVQATLLLLRLIVRTSLALPLTLSPQSALSGLAVSLLIGLLFGTLPARSASRLHPLEAINHI